MKKFRFIIIVIIILIAFNEILDYQNEKTRETLKQDRVKAEKRLEKSKDTIPQILLVPAKKIDSLWKNTNLDRVLTSLAENN